MYCLGQIFLVIVCLHVNRIIYKHHNWHCMLGHGIQYVWKVLSLCLTRFLSYTSLNSNAVYDYYIFSATQFWPYKLAYPVEIELKVSMDMMAWDPCHALLCLLYTSASNFSTSLFSTGGYDRNCTLGIMDSECPTCQRSSPPPTGGRRD